MEIIDTHIHIYSEEFAADRDILIGNALAAGVIRMYMPNIDMESTGPMMELAHRYPGKLFPMFGLHPTSVEENAHRLLDEIIQASAGIDFPAVGEIGIDLYWDKTFATLQEDIFIRQVQWANSLQKPIVIHSRESTDILIHILSARQQADRRGIFHCFTGTTEQAQQITDMGYLLGIGGVITFKNSQLREVLKTVSPEHIVLETDAPYLAPVPYRGKRNAPIYITETLAAVAAVYELPTDQMAHITTTNALKIFGS